MYIVLGKNTGYYWSFQGRIQGGGGAMGCFTPSPPLAFYEISERKKQSNCYTPVRFSIGELVDCYTLVGFIIGELMDCYTPVGVTFGELVD